MSITDKKGINVTSGFKLISGQPIDARFNVEDETELQSLIDNGAVYEGLHVWVKSLGKEKVWNGTEFTEIQASGGNTDSSEAIVEVDKLPITMEGTAVPESGLVKKVYFNTKMNPVDVANILDTLEYYDLSSVGISFPAVVVHTSSDLSTGIVIGNFSGPDYKSYSIIYQSSEGAETIYEYSESSAESSIIDDWSGIENVDINVENVLGVLGPQFGVSNQNEEIKNLISVTPFVENWDNVNSNVIYKVKEKLSIYPMYWQGRSLTDIANEQLAGYGIAFNAIQCVVSNSYPTENIKPMNENLDDTNSIINFNFYYIEGVLDSYNTTEIQPPIWNGYDNTIARVANIIGTTPASVQIVANLSEAIDSTTLYIVKEFINYADPTYYLLDKNTKNKFQIQEKVNNEGESEENPIEYISLINTGSKIGELIINDVSTDIIAIPLLEKTLIESSYIEISEEEIELIRNNRSTLIRVIDGYGSNYLSFVHRLPGNIIQYSGIFIENTGKILQICRLIINDNVQRPDLGRRGTYVRYSLPFERDTIPTENSTNLVTSGGVKTYVDSEIASKITNVLNSSF